MDETIKEMRKFVSGDHHTIYKMSELEADGFKLLLTAGKIAEFTRKGHPGMLYKFSIYKDQGFLYSNEYCVNFQAGSD